MYETTDPDALAKQQKVIGLLEELLSEGGISAQREMCRVRAGQFGWLVFVICSGAG
jgi:hypothetical protein